MTRGKFAIITDKGMFTSYEFNGDMYNTKNGHGPEVIERLGRVNNKDDLVREVEEFNANNFEYEGEFNKPYFIEGLPVSFHHETYFDKYFSDYVYVKNLCSETKEIIDYDGKEVEIEPNQILVFHFGHLETENEED